MHLRKIRDSAYDFVLRHRMLTALGSVSTVVFAVGCSYPTCGVGPAKCW